MGLGHWILDLESSETLSRPSQVDGAIKKEIPFKTVDFLENLGLRNLEDGTEKQDFFECLPSGLEEWHWHGSSRLLAARTVIDAMCE